MRAPRASLLLFATVAQLLCLACSPARSELVAEQAAAVRAEAPVAVAGDHGAGAHRHHIRKHARRPERPRLQGNLSLPCAPGCEQRGNCNIEEGRCECPYGWAGPACEQALFPACKVLDGSEELFCKERALMSCECLRQCHAFYCKPLAKEPWVYDCTNFRAPHDYCFERPGGAASQDSVIPAAGEPGVRYYYGFINNNQHIKPPQQEISRERFEHAYDNHTSVVPLSECACNCSGHGYCMKWGIAQPWCACFAGFFGTNCESAQAELCLNSCNGRGTCRQGFCHCQKGWFGRDCSRSSAHPRPGPGHIQPLNYGRLRIYIYELPWNVAFNYFQEAQRAHHDTIYTAFDKFSEQLSGDWEVRTEDPWEANLFFVPALLLYSALNAGNPTIALRPVVEYIKQHWPFFNRTGGADHFLWMPGDFGACEISEQERDLAGIIKITHWGWYRPDPAADSFHRMVKNNTRWGCHSPVRDIVAPPFVRHEAWAVQQAFADLADKPPKGPADPRADSLVAHHPDPQGRSPGPSPSLGLAPASRPRDITLFFSGSVVQGVPDYSGNVRQAVQNWTLRYNASDVVFSHSRDDYMDFLLRSKYCLAPYGWGWGIRLSQIILSGCVPVIIQPHVFQPLEDLLDYNQFAIRLPRSAVDTLDVHLRAIPDAEYQRLCSNLKRASKSFLWGPDVGGRAYDYTLASLQRRLWRLASGHLTPSVV